MKAAAVLCCRNEEIHVAPAIETFLREGLEVVLIDHDSTDQTVPIARRYLGRGLLCIEHLPWEGAFSLAAQLDAKHDVIGRLDHDWVVHADADEWLTAPGDGTTLLAGLEEADAAGANCVNFDEFVLVPAPGEDLEAPDYRERMTRYYFYSPPRGPLRRARRERLPRAWKPRSGLDNRGHGHRIAGPARFHSGNFVLRHYICLSESHLRRKYLGRRFDPAELARGWHWDRAFIAEEPLQLREDPRIRELGDWRSNDFERVAPSSDHFWKWPQPRPQEHQRRVRA
jgi:glycosyltransferase involved in cell wall biosynthesis